MEVVELKQKYKETWQKQKSVGFGGKKILTT
jgi:hypothetical protein